MNNLKITLDKGEIVMKSKRNLSIFVALILVFILTVGIKAVNSNSNQGNKKIAYSESSSFSTLSSQKETKVTKNDQKKTSSKTAVKDSDEKASKDSSKSSTEVESDSSKLNSETNPKNKESKKNEVSTKHTETTNKESINSDVDKSSSKTESVPVNPAQPQQEEQEITKPSESPVPPTPPKVEEVAPPVEEPEEIPEVPIPIETVMVSVTSDPSVKGTILYDTAVEYSEGDTALDVTLRIFKQNGIPYEVTGSGSSAYMRGIDNLREFAEGPLSGWHIRVNGKMIDRSAGAYAVEPGDSVNWNYTKNYLEDSGDW